MTMEWLTALLAFAITMLVFSIIVSTLVETIHRFLGSRSFGLIMMLEHFYDGVIRAYLDDGQKETQREAFIARMVRVRAPASSSDASTPIAKDGWMSRLLLPLMSLWSWINRASRTARKLGVNQWHLLSDLPIETFMERLGSSSFSDVLDRKYASDPATRQEVLKDIAQKFELYGQEAKIYFERKARTISVLVAMGVAWAFYVHPSTLMQTFLQRPEVAAGVADLKDDLLKRVGEVEQELQAGGAGSDEKGEDIRAALGEIEKELEPLKAAGVPIGWPEDKRNGLFCEDAKNDRTCWLYYPKDVSDFFWLLMGGLLVGLGAPFWAKAIGQIIQAQGISQNISKILKPGTPPATTETVQVTSAETGPPVTTEAFEVAAVGKQVSGR
ncbi:MAG: hypothetical protein R3F54_17075 [Alphaproteobacteria bacterium]